MFKRILLLSILLLFSVKAFSIDNTPSQVVKEFYTMYVKQFQEDDEYIGEETYKAYSKIATPEILKYVSKDLANKIKIASSYSAYDEPTKLYEYNTEGGDYFLQSQYFYHLILKTLKIKKETIKGTYAQVVINYYIFPSDNPNRPTKIVVTLKKENGEWKIIKVRELN